MFASPNYGLRSVAEIYYGSLERSLANSFQVYKVLRFIAFNFSGFVGRKCVRAASALEKSPNNQSFERIWQTRRTLQQNVP